MVIKTCIKNIIIMAVKNAAQTALVIIGTSTFINNVSWLQVISASTMSALISVLTNITKIPLKEVEKNDD